MEVVGGLYLHVPGGDMVAYGIGEDLRVWRLYHRLWEERLGKRRGNQEGEKL